MKSPVYVDEIFVYPIDAVRGAQAKRVSARNRGQWCHMWSEDVEALHRMAAAIGMRRDWFQDRPGFPHYDLVPRRRAAAIRAGAVVMPLMEYLRKKAG